MKRYRETWVVRNRPGNVSELMRAFGLSDVCARIIWNRGYQSVSDVSSFLYGHDEPIVWPKLPGEEEFLFQAAQALSDGDKIRIIGDYDVDGVTATYLMCRALRLLGAEVDYRIPDRVADGYGISAEMAEEAARDGVRTIITVDNGIAAVSQIAAAVSHGIRVLVTDHHEPQETLPPAQAIVDPKVAPEEEQITNLCGAVVAGILADRLLANAGRPGYAESNVEVLALATVCDVMPLTGIARNIVRRGLRKPTDRWNEGLQALAAANHLEGECRCYHLGFVLGPCINALGRLETADYGVELLLGDDARTMRECATRMVMVNENRKEQTRRCTEAAIALADSVIAETPDTSVLVLYLPECHESLAGIVAGKVREAFARPSFILTDAAGEPGVLKGSGRSTESFSMFEGLMDCRELFLKFGGHAMAAGVTIPAENLAAFRESMESSFRMQGATTVGKTTIDLVMPLRYVTRELVQELSLLEPFGSGNSKPVFAQKNVRIVSLRTMGKNGQFLSLRLRDAEGTDMQAVYFGDASEFLDGLAERYGNGIEAQLRSGRGEAYVDLCYYPDVNRYNGEEYLQIQIGAYHFPENA